MPVLPKLMYQSSFHIECIMYPAGLDGMWTYLHIVKTVAWLMIPQIPSSHQNLTVKPWLRGCRFILDHLVTRHLSLSEFWPFSHWAGGCLFSENRKGQLRTMMNVLYLNTLQPPLVFKAKVIFFLLMSTRCHPVTRDWKLPEHSLLEILT